MADQVEASDIKRRIADTLGGYGALSRFARAMGLSVEHVGRALNGKHPVPEAWVAAVEFLEIIPEERRPSRWARAQQLGE